MIIIIIITVPMAHPPTLTQSFCHLVSYFSTGYGTFTSFVTVTSLDGR